MRSFQNIPEGHWFPVALSGKVTAKPQRVMFCDAPLVVARDARGQAFALEDRCAHRGVPLSKGKSSDSGIVCPFHGWAFDAQGRCTHMPGTEDGCPMGDVRVPALATRERDGVLWVSPRADAPLPDRVLAMAPEHRRFLWQTVWRAPIIEVLENFLDPLHTHSIHPGLVRRGARRAVDAELQRHGDGFHVDYTGNEQQSGILFKLFESPRTLERAWMSSLGVAQLEYRYASGWSACISINCAPQTADTTHVFATLHVQGRWAPAWLVKLFVWPFLRKVAEQDETMLEIQNRAAHEFAGRKTIVSPMDLVRPYIDAAWGVNERELPDRRQVRMHL